MKEVMSLQADTGAEGARVNMAPVKKGKIFLASMSAVITILVLQIFVFILFLIYGLNVDFGNNYIFIAITCITAVFTGAFFGAVIGTVIKGNRSFKTGILIASTMLMSFLSGMMMPQFKYIIEGKIPILSKINPVTLVTDSFYFSYYYSDYTKYVTNILILWGINLVFGITAYMVIRRQKYASI